MTTPKDEYLSCKVCNIKREPIRNDLDLLNRFNEAVHHISELHAELKQEHDAVINLLRELKQKDKLINDITNGYMEKIIQKDAEIQKLKAKLKEIEKSIISCPECSKIETIRKILQEKP